MKFLNNADIISSVLKISMVPGHVYKTRSGRYKMLVCVDSVGDFVVDLQTGTGCPYQIFNSNCPLKEVTGQFVIEGFK